ncbi:tetratricopeptide repeat protein [Sorangium sp. So ce394]|uniref:tetratricopeptide repeat protein n=1 Tax=Sorangium sp. So ce394 TaxID=3133310 RepID=UPI003F5C0084
MGPTPATKASAYNSELTPSLAGPPTTFRLRQIAKDCLATIPKVPTTEQGPLHHILGICYAERGIFDEALRHFNAAYAIMSSKISYLNAVSALTDLGRAHDALARVMKVANDGLDFMVLLRLSGIFASMGQINDARNALEDAAEQASTAFDHFRVATVAADMGLHVEACEMFARAIAIDMRKPLGDARAIDFIIGAPDELKGCLRYHGARSLQASIQKMMDGADELLAYHRILAKLAHDVEPLPETISDAQEVFDSMTPLRLRANRAVMHGGDHG